jgi:glutamate synthase domain-containing protein 2
LRRQHPDQLLGLVVTSGTLATLLPWALDHQLDLLVLDGTAGMATPWVELDRRPDLTLWRETIGRLRQLGKEEEIALVHFGGMRTGTDVAKALAVNCTAAVFSLAAGVALGGTIVGQRLVFPEDQTSEALAEALNYWICAVSQETAMIARCTGKTNVHNLEPEDMRCITVAAESALGIPLASGQAKRHGF